LIDLSPTPKQRTHRDIDRFGKAVLEGWLSSGSGSGSGDCEDASGGGNARMLGSAVAASRSVCRLPNLIGAAPVVYGVPCLINSSTLAQRR